MTITASIVGPTFVTVMMDGTTHTINQDHTNYNAIREALKIKDHSEIEKLINVKDSVINFARGAVTVRGDQVFYGDMEVKGSVVQRILQMVREGFDSQPMLNFLANLMANPSKRAVDELYGFLEATALPITDDGCFLAYKKVRNDYRDFFTGTMDNSVGTVLEMPRNQVDEDKDRTCSYGLHFCSLSYLPHYHGGNGRVMIVKINPADVVAVPADYNNAKGRAARYEIIGEIEGGDRENKDYFTSPVYNGTSPYTPPVLDQSDDEFDLGYDAGTAKAKRDSDALASYDGHIPPTGQSEAYVDGFSQGYDDHYFVDFMQAGYEQAENDVEHDCRYDDSVPFGCTDADDQRDYRAGYADGWRDAKVRRLG